MKRWHYLVFFVLGLIVPLWVTSRQDSPGYMDAEYYFAGGLRLAQGHGFTEVIIWNYLAEPMGPLNPAVPLERPSHTYWMPLASLLAAVGMYLTKSLNFNAARLGFLLVAGCVPPLTAALAWQLTHHTVHAKLAGVLAALPGLYLPFITTTDVFGLQMVLGAAFFWLVCYGFSPQRVKIALVAAALGILSGFMHLARAEGLLWLGAAGLFVIAQATQNRRDGRELHLTVLAGLIVVTGYLSVMFPWYLRNLQVFHTLFAPGNNRALWLLEYNELFLFPGSLLTFNHWISAGVGRLLQNYLWAAGLNLQTALAVQAQIFLAPLILLGAWQLRERPAVWIGGIMWLAILAVMTLVFPFQGGRGGFFHAGAAFQPLFWALAPTGLEIGLTWLAKCRRWNLSLARPAFRGGVILLGIFLTGLIAWTRLPANHAADSAENRYQSVEAYLLQQGSASTDIVMVNNPPGYFVASFTPKQGGRPAISIPFGDLEMVRQVGRVYGAKYLLLEFNQLLGDDDLYNLPGDRPGLDYLREVAGIQIYRFLPVAEGQEP